MGVSGADLSREGGWGRGGGIRGEARGGWGLGSFGDGADCFRWKYGLGSAPRVPLGADYGCVSHLSPVNPVSSSSSESVSVSDPEDSSSLSSSSSSFCSR